MLRNNKILLTILLSIVLLPYTVYGQFRESISADSRSIQKADGLVSVDMNIIIHNLKIGANEYMVLTPALISETGQVQKMSDVIITGTITQKKYDRYLGLGGEPTEAYIILQLPHNQNQSSIPYWESVPYQQWMDNAELVLIAESCGCGDDIKQTDIIPVTYFQLQKPVFLTTYIVPPDEAEKKRIESGEAYVIFPVNKTTLLHDLGNNAEELAKIRKSVDYVREVNDIRVNNITIEAYASPEGPLENNLRLSEGRAAALRDYVIQYYQMDRSLFTIRSKGENWEGLREAVRASYGFTETQKQDILNIIDIDDLNTRKSRLQSYAGGEPYRNMLANIYPRLRRSEYHIEYTVPAFSVEEGEKLLHTKPGMLSLKEMYSIANSYDKNSGKFKEVFDIAVRIYPNDMIANLNAAAIALDNKDTETAERYLKPYMNSPEAYNNIGIMYALKDNNEMAKQYFEWAANAGNREAMENLNKIK